MQLLKGVVFYMKRGLLFWGQLAIYMQKIRHWLIIILVSLFFCFLYSSYIPSQAMMPIPFANIVVSTSMNFEAPTTEPIEIDPNCPSGNVIYEDFCVVTPYGLQNRTSDEAVTLCTQGTLQFLYHVPVLCHRWSGPISVAVYCTEDDYSHALLVVNSLRRCDICVKTWVDWHFFYRKRPMPDIWESPFIEDCGSIPKKEWPQRRSKETYPINVGRNLARNNTQTPYVFSIDMELYPSIGLLPKFNRMIQSQPPLHNLQVWVIPVFEVQSDYRAPMTVKELKSMFLKKQVISFHKFRCDICHRIPNLTQWINNENGLSEAEESLEPLKIWTTVKRSRQFRLQFWEPFFIGTKNDPEFDIRLSWEGKQNKMQMAYEMCIQNFDFHIAENAFLVHSPGINKFDASKEQYRVQPAKHNHKIMSEIKRKYSKHELHKNCR